MLYISLNVRLKSEFNSRSGITGISFGFSLDSGDFLRFILSSMSIFKLGLLLDDISNNHYNAVVPVLP